MSAGTTCRCTLSPTARRVNWRVRKRNYNQSAFNGYRRTYSAYSTVVCTMCRANWRTKAAYVETLRDYSE